VLDLSIAETATGILVGSKTSKGANTRYMLCYGSEKEMIYSLKTRTWGETFSMRVLAAGYSVKVIESNMLFEDMPERRICSLKVRLDCAMYLVCSLKVKYFPGYVFWDLYNQTLSD
jgi:hypothetical protein